MARCVIYILVFYGVKVLGKVCYMQLYILGNDHWQGELDAAWYFMAVKVLGNVSYMQPFIFQVYGYFLYAILF